MFAALMLTMGMWIQPASGAVAISISVGDRPYYDGPSYWDNGYEWVWVPGYRHHHHWVHGHYAKHGDFHREHAGEHHKHHHG